MREITLIYCLVRYWPVVLFLGYLRNLFTHAVVIWANSVQLMLTPFPPMPALSGTSDTYLLFTIILEKYLVLESHTEYTIVLREKPTWSSRVKINFDNYFNKRFTWTIECNCAIYHVPSNCFIVDQFGHWSVF